jgi:hypothetical protein
MSKDSDSIFRLNKPIRSEEASQNVTLEHFDMSQISDDCQKILIKWQKFDLGTCVASTAGIISSLIEYEIAFSEERTVNNCKNNPVNVLKLLTLISTVIATVFVYLRYKTQRALYLYKHKAHFKEHYKHIFDRKSVLLSTLLMEFGILWIFPYPYLDLNIEAYQNRIKVSDRANIYICYKQSEIFLVIMFIRFYFIVKCILKNSSYLDVFSSYYCDKLDTRANFRFALKSSVERHKWKVMLLIL